MQSHAGSGECRLATLHIKNHPHPEKPDARCFQRSPEFRHPEVAQAGGSRRRLHPCKAQSWKWSSAASRRPRPSRWLSRARFRQPHPSRRSGHHRNAPTPRKCAARDNHPVTAISGKPPARVSRAARSRHRGRIDRCAGRGPMPAKLQRKKAPAGTRAWRCAVCSHIPLGTSNLA